MMNIKNNMFFIAISFLSVEILLLLSYFLFYNPHLGAFPLLISSLLAIFGMLVSFKIDNIKLKYWVILAHLLVFFIFPIVLTISFYFGF